MATEALYIHIPFCKKRCSYCDFTSSTCKYGDTRAEVYAQKLLFYSSVLRSAGLFQELKTAYIGGGTPTMLGHELLPQLIASVSQLAPLHELSFEANPDSLDAKMQKLALKAGATRVSIGVQSFVDIELEALGRIHSAQTATQTLRRATKSHLYTSCDLMCGIPYQNLDSWTYSLKNALALGINHVSVYPLMIEEGTRMEQLCDSGKLPWPDDDVQAEYMEIAERMLYQAGFERYEVASYARPGCECKHNIAYWTGKEYIGLGTSAASMLERATYEHLAYIAPQLPNLDPTTQRIRLTCTSSIDEFIAAKGLGGISFEIEELTAKEAVSEDLMLGARMSRGLSDELIERARDCIGTQRVETTLENLAERELLSYQGGLWKPTHTGWLLGNELYGALWSLAS